AYFEERAIGEVFNAPVDVPKGKLIDLLDAMLEQYGFTITFDPASGFYIVQPLADIRPVFGDELASTRIIPTPNIKPSLLVEPLRAMVGGGGQGAQGGTGQGGPIQAVDELGVLIINAPSRDIRRIERMVDELIKIDRDQQYIRFELDHLAAPIALDRVVGLAGGTRERQSITGQNRGRVNQNQQQQGGAVVSLAGGSLTNLGERMTIDPQGNALIFKGTDNEIDRVRQLLAVIDVPNTLEPRNYFAGSSASQIADIAKRRGLGEVIQIESQADQISQQFNRFGNQNNQFDLDDEGGEGGPVMVVDPARGNIIYYGTREQQAQLADLLDELRTEDERVVIREYTLNHTDALTITDLLMGIITGESQTGESDLLPGGTNRNQTFFNGFPMNVDGESTGDFDPDKIAVIADEFSNQVIIKAPIKQQDELEKLIERLDKQRPQVYIQAMIVSVTDNEDFTLAFESQFTSGEFSVGTDFGLSSPGASFSDPRSVATGLDGITAAIIKSEYIPLIINATQSNTDVRILSTPQLLVNDNEESSIVSIEEQPYTEISQGDGNNNLVGFGGYAEAGTTLTVTPSISKAGFIRLQYYVELSNFFGTGSDGIPPPTTRRTVEGSATVPSNATIVLGGITVDDIRDTVLKVPFIGDIPLVGELFRRTNKVNNKSRLYVFLTPRIMSDSNFNDLKLFSQGPQHEMDIDDHVPVMMPAIIGVPGGDPSPSPLPRPASDLPGPAVAEPDGDTGFGDRTDRIAPELEPAYIEHRGTGAGNN
ncbi:MAG: secretin N-terminal domain-containing protein, partial [Phycisphaerales bacterium]